MTKSFSIVDRTLLADESGAVLVEATIFLPVLLMLALGMFEFGRALDDHHVIDKAVRDAGRYLAHVPVTCPGGTVANAGNETTAKNIALTGTPSGGSPRLDYWSDPGTISISISCHDNTDGALYGKPYIPLINVTATVPYASVGVLDILGLGPMTFSLSHQEVGFDE